VFKIPKIGDQSPFKSLLFIDLEYHKDTKCSRNLTVGF